MTPLDDLELKLRAAFGEPAAEREQRAIAESGVNPIEIFERTGVDERWES